jgi:DNA polymerase-1
MRQRREAFPVQMEWTEKIVAQAASGALLDNGFGRLMRPDPERAGTQGPALMGQGAARDIMGESLLRLAKAWPGVTSYLRGVVHDEIVLSVPEADVAEWAIALEAAFTWEWRGVPILCDLSKPAYRWSECK